MAILGAAYPVANGVADNSTNFGIEGSSKSKLIRLPLISVIVESANMLILILAHVQATSDDSLISTYVSASSTFPRTYSQLYWSQSCSIPSFKTGLIISSLTPYSLVISAFQSTANVQDEKLNSFVQKTRYTSDRLPIANQSNLALKGIIGIRAMSEIAQYKHDSNATTFYKVLRVWHNFFL